VHNYTSTYARKQGVQLDKKLRYEHIPKSVETSRGGKVAILWNQQGGKGGQRAVTLFLWAEGVQGAEMRRRISA
jgi:hypothetical protein